MNYHAIRRTIYAEGKVHGNPSRGGTLGAASLKGRTTILVRKGELAGRPSTKGGKPGDERVERGLRTGDRGEYQSVIQNREMEDKEYWSYSRIEVGE